MPRPSTTLTVRDQSFVVERRLLEDLPDAAAFIGHLLDRRVAPHTAKIYVTAVCRLKRRGQLADLRVTSNVNERTAASAYNKWRAETWTARAQEIAKAVPGLRSNRVRFLRRHSISPPMPGKVIPVHGLPTSVDLADYLPPEPGLSIVRDGEPISPRALPKSEPAITWQSAENLWTLHVPKALTAPHVDPCLDCDVFTLDGAAMEALAQAFEKTWGHRDLNALSPESYLFGSPPVESEETMAQGTREKALALVMATSARLDDMNKIGVPIVLDVGSAIEKFSNVDGVYLSRTACGNRLNEVLSGLWNAWGAK